MKSEALIRENLKSKIGLLDSGFNRSSNLKNHIIMLDWVLNDGLTRSIEEIIKEYTE